jgi:hypothetical protein
LHKAPTLDLRMNAWREDLEMVERVIPGFVLAAELSEELRLLEQERSRPAAGGEPRGRN